MLHGFGLSDVPIERARHFNFDVYASSIARTIASPVTRTPLVIGIHGRWGSGKTSLMRTTKMLLDTRRPGRELQDVYIFSRECASNEQNFRKVRTVWFNAWKYSSATDSLAALILQILKQMAQDGLSSSLKSQLVEMGQKDWGKVVAELLGFELGVEAGVGVKGTLGWDLGSFVAEFLKGSRVRQNVPFYDDFQAEFNALIQAWVGFDDENPEQSGVLAIFIDDLDRCAPSRVAEVFESLLLYLDTPGCVFVVGADVEYVASAIDKHYSQFSPSFDGNDYLEKVFQFSFELPPIRRSDVGSFLTELVPRERYDKQQLELISQTIEPSPRQIKRFLNSVEFWLGLARETPAVSQLMKTGASCRKRIESLIVEWIAVCLCHEGFEQAVRQTPAFLLSGLLAVAEPEIQALVETAQPAEIEKTRAVRDEIEHYLADPELRDLLLAYPSDSVGLPTIEETSLVVHLTRAPDYGPTQSEET